MSTKSVKENWYCPDDIKKENIRKEEVENVRKDVV